MHDVKAVATHMTSPSSMVTSSGKRAADRMTTMSKVMLEQRLDDSMDFRYHEAF